ncbi:MAG: hypothetical protein C0471_01095 [Erythrobacter sp.]|nr:hypothetical protein [Erythrobacter sp.]
MSAAAILRDLAGLCATSAKQCTDAYFKLGPQPAEGPAANLWRLQRSRLQRQVSSLDALNIELGAAAIASALEEHAADLRAISEASQEAQEQIKKIKDATELLTKVARVIELGSAIVAAAALPNAATIAAAINAARTLLDPAEE